MLSCFIAEDSHHWHIRHQTPSILIKHRTHFRFTMKFSALIAITGALAPVSAIPQYLSTPGFVPQEWMAPSASDCKLREQTSVPSIYVLYTNRSTQLVVPAPDSILWQTMATSLATARTSTSRNLPRACLPVTTSSTRMLFFFGHKPSGPVPSTHALSASTWLTLGATISSSMIFL
jgi:hypothetical protein